MAPNGHEYAPKDFRLELLDAGNPLEFNKSPRGWFGNGFRRYVDFERDNAVKAAMLFVALDPPSSSD